MSSKPSIANIEWSKDSHALIWKLLAELEKGQNHVLLFGLQKGQKTTKDSKIGVAKRIGSVILPELYAQDPDTVGSRIKGKADNLHARYKEEVKHLQQTGGGIGGNRPDSRDANEYLDCYVGAGGPDETTTSEACNLWEEINQRFPFFATMHRFLASRPNAVPPAITTGVGPDGRRILHLQASQNTASTHSAPPPIPDHLIDPALRNTVASQAIPVVNSGSVDTNKENAPPAVAEPLKRGPKPSTFDAAKHVQNAKKNLKAIPKKRSLEDVLLEAVKEKEASSARKALLKARQIKLDENSQIMRMVEIGLLTKEEGRLRLLDVEKDDEQPQKKIRLSDSPSSSPQPSSPINPRSSSPIWNEDI
ncbi:hypothetical protein EST38_g11039 [Candolleomyces aberdarensis]|uniref:Uncharacterized protein n=1 Tax=Candolleomyces aberdarensis TaxID=2316362 RepID=A0A4Q2D5V9_9AGAR|nr:hypothetical protein EST38_g11039 [Candolleomyces aberdarensis]